MEGIVSNAASAWMEDDSTAQRLSGLLYQCNDFNNL